MFRRLLIAAVLATGTIAAVAVPTVSASEPTDAHHHHYKVMYRHHSHWHVYGVYHNWSDADRAMHRLRHRGYNAEIRHDHRH